MSTPNTAVENVSTGADKAKVMVAALLVVGALVAYYALGGRDLWQRVVALLVLPKPASA
jgi:preprotein translocase subunit SecE